MKVLRTKPVPVVAAANGTQKAVMAVINTNGKTIILNRD